MCSIDNINLQTIFIIDDDIQYLKILKRLLENDNNVYTYSNGYDAMKDLNKYKPKIVILDYDMPIISGLEIYKKFQEELKLIKVLIITSNITAIDRFKKLGIKNYLIKPFKISSFLNILQN